MIRKQAQENIKRVLYAGLLVSCILCLFRCYERKDALWVWCFAPLLLSEILLVPTAQLYISYSCSKLQSSSIGSLLYAIYSFSLSIFAFTLLVSLKLDDIITGSWYPIFIPLWYAVFIYSCFTIFIFPGMMDPTVDLSREAWVLIGFMLSLITSSVLFSFWIAEERIYHIWHALFPVMLTTVCGLITFIYSRVKKSSISKEFFTHELILYVSLLPLFTTLIIEDEDENSVPDYVHFIFVFAFIIASWLIEEKANYQHEREHQEQVKYHLVES